MYVKKELRATFTMAKGYFAGQDNTLVVSGLPMVVRITKPGGGDQNKLTLDIQGLNLSTMEKLTVLGFRPLQSLNNLISIEAGIENDLSLAFSGEISQAYARFDSSGNAFFTLEALAGSYPQKLATPATSVDGQARIEDLMLQFAREAGYAFENQGVTESVSNSRFSGSPITKARSLERQANITLLIDDNKFIIMPRRQTRQGTTVRLTKSTGLLGYPTFTNDGIKLRALYDKNFQLEGLIELESIVPKASGTWRITKLEHLLDANFSNATNWFTDIDAVWMQE